jgi:hypothetical protein
MEIGPIPRPDLIELDEAAELPLKHAIGGIA